MIVEWNTHLFSSDTQRYPFWAGASYTPDAAHLDADPLATYMARMEAIGIDRAVIVQPEPYGDDHRLVLDSLAREPERLKGTCLFLPQDPDAPRKLADLTAAHPALIAQRFHAYREKDGFYFASFHEPRVRALWQRAGELGLVIELHISPNYARQVADLARDYPDFPVLVDHMGEPQMGTEEEYDDVLDLARCPNIIMKMSGLNHFSRQPAPHEDVRDLVRRVAVAFGPERLVWSAGSPATVDALLTNWSSIEWANVKGRNLARLARFT